MIFPRLSVFLKLKSPRTYLDQWLLNSRPHWSCFVPDSRLRAFLPANASLRELLSTGAFLPPRLRTQRQSHCIFSEYKILWVSSTAVLAIDGSCIINNFLARHFCDRTCLHWSEVCFIFAIARVCTGRRHASSKETLRQWRSWHIRHPSSRSPSSS